MNGRALGANWGEDKRKREKAAQQRAAERADSARVEALQRQRFAELARAHRHENQYFESVSAQLDAGRPITPKQAATLLKIAGERGWPTKATSAAAKSNQGTANSRQGKIEGELRDYVGFDEELSEFAKRCQRGDVLTNAERGRANWLLRQEGLR